jgi:hypothetical protein
MHAYAHVVPQPNRDAVDRMADAFQGADDSGPNGDVVTDAGNPPKGTDPENDEGPPQRPWS